MGMLSLVLATTLAATPAPAVDDEAIAQAASRAWQEQLAAELRSSGSPRERALTTRMYDLDGSGVPPDGVARGKMLRDAALAAPGDRLVQLIWAMADEQDSGCDPSHPCPERPMALARLEPDNAAAWLPLMDKADHEHDDKLRDLALEKMAAATYYDGLFAESVDAWLTVLERHPMPPALRRQGREDMARAGTSRGVIPDNAAEIGVAFAYAGLQPIPPSGLFKHCRADSGSAAADAAKADKCRQLAHVMMQGPSFVERALGSALLRRFDEREALEARRKLDWLMWQSLPAPNGNDAMGRDLGAYISDLRSTRSEVRAVELAMQRWGLPMSPPAGWQRPAAVAPAPEEK